MAASTTNAANKGRSSERPPPPGGYGGGTGERGTLSARTCIELAQLMSEEQLDREFKHLTALDPTLKFGITTKTTLPNKKAKLIAYLTGTLCNEADRIVDNIHNLLLNPPRSNRVGSAVTSNVDDQQTTPASASQILITKQSPIQ